MIADSVEANLGHLVQRLSPLSSLVSIRGSGAGRFLYIVCNGRSAEVSPAEEKWWVELWGSLEEDAQPEIDVMLDSIAEVEVFLLDYFFPEGAQFSSF
ncbi:hypothetical protein [Lysobacter brunescens]|uniref:Integron gene cassette protein n=1 Tax=Lysobacter brunescens TaxID=262323 RepID=A0ABW2YHY7_9GAMM